MDVVSCTCWVKRGVSASTPKKVELSPQELQKVIKSLGNEAKSKKPEEEGEDEEDEDMDTEQDVQMEQDEAEESAADEFNLDNYDEEPGDMVCSIKNIVSFGKDGKDPLITGDDNDSEEEDDIIKPGDNLVLKGRVMDSGGHLCVLEVYVYNEAEGSFYCHHEYLLPSFPLCIEWLNFDPTDSKPGNLCAIGTMSPIIEVWDLDMVNSLEPAFKLGCKPSKKKKLKRVGHKDAVLDLAWNENYAHVLASGSVDQTVLLWDLENGNPVTKFDCFQEKVQSLKWHPSEKHHLLTGCADKSVRLFDCMYEKMSRSWEVQGEVARVLWNHYDPNYCLASTENGYVNYIDVRQSEPIWRIQAHEKEVTGLSMSSSCPGLLVTSSDDSVVKVWDILSHVEPILVHERQTNLGCLQCLAPNPDNPFLFAVGGDSKGHNFRVFDLRETNEVRERFESRIEEETGEQSKRIRMTDSAEER